MNTIICLQRETRNFKRQFYENFIPFSLQSNTKKKNNFQFHGNIHD